MLVAQQPNQACGQEQPLSWPPYGALHCHSPVSVCLCVCVSEYDSVLAGVCGRQKVHMLCPQWDPHHERCHDS